MEHAKTPFNNRCWKPVDSQSSKEAIYNVSHNKVWVGLNDSNELHTKFPFK